MDDWWKSLSPVQSFFRSDDAVESDNRATPFVGLLAMSMIEGDTLSVPLPPKIPKGPPGHWNSDELIKRVQVGVMVELSTIPLYLYAMYSVKTTKPEGVNAYKKLRGLADRPKPLPSASLTVFPVILQQEMLHLALVGNLLSALGGSLDLYDRRVVPQYAGYVLLDRVPMTLRRLDAKSLGYFVKVRMPQCLSAELFLPLSLLFSALDRESRPGSPSCCS